jgi:hypothetical protein
MPPDLGKPYSSEVERAADREALLIYWYGVELLTNLANQPAAQWSPEQAQLFPSSVHGGPPEHPHQRLQRWLTLYGDEIGLIRGVRNRLVHGRLEHGGVVTDPELRAAAWLARQVLSTATGVLPSEVTASWVRALVGRAVR